MAGSINIKNSHLLVKHAGYRLGATAGEGSQPLPNTVLSTNSPPEQVRMNIFYYIIIIIIVAVQNKLTTLIKLITSLHYSLRINILIVFRCGVNVKYQDCCHDNLTSYFLWYM